MPRETYGESYQFLAPEERLSYGEITRLVGIFAGFGVRKVKLTGGEPLLRPWIENLVSSVTQVPGIADVGMITNGYHLERSIDRLRTAGLHRLTVSLDTVHDDTWRKINGRGYPVERVLTGIRAAVAAGFRPVKINAVVQRGVNEDQIMDLVKEFRTPDYVVRFIEYMDVGTLNHWRSELVVPSAEILGRIAAEFPVDPVEPAYRGEVARRYRYRDGQGEIGFISSVSEPFCRDCTRARLSADGRLFTCLFARDGYDLKTPMRSGASDADLAQAVERTWVGRDDRYSETRSKSGKSDAVEMFQIGG
jgi:cyclic pyranopterin phosphate synthase